MKEGRKPEYPEKTPGDELQKKGQEKLSSCGIGDTEAGSQKQNS